MQRDKGMASQDQLSFFRLLTVAYPEDSCMGFPATLFLWYGYISSLMSLKELITGLLLHFSVRISD